MKTPQEITDKLDYRQEIGFEPPQQDNAGRLIQVWATLADVYGSAFVNQFGDYPNEAWAGGLSKYPIERIEHALHEIVMEGGSFAPNLASVIQHIEGGDAKAKMVKAQQMRQARNNNLPRLPSNALSPDQALERLRKIREENGI